MATTFNDHIQRGLSRLISTLQSNLSAEITAVKDADLELPAPDSDDYYVLHDSNKIDELVRNRAVAVFVYPTAPASYESMETIDSTSYGARAVWQADVLLQFLQMPQDTFISPYTGQTITSDEIMTLRAHRYLGAIQNCVTKFTLGSDDVLSLDPISGGGYVDFDPASERPPFGQAVSSFEIMQHVTIPTRQ